jgi:hypothetical protein
MDETRNVKGDSLSREKGKPTAPEIKKRAPEYSGALA